MKIAFHAPMKPPDHPTPSGDRRIARMLISALKIAGHEVRLVSRFRSYDAQGDPARQIKIKSRGERLARRLIDKYRAVGASWRPDAWFTYHLYHKAPDWLGPMVSKALAIPYMVAEASHAPKRRNGPWAVGFRACEDAIRNADVVFCLNPVDRKCIEPLLNDHCRMVLLKPFIDAGPYLAAASERGMNRREVSRRHGISENIPWLLTVAMMRDGDKLYSYRILAGALAGLLDKPWRLLIVGDGPARPKVADAMSGFADRISWLGEKTRTGTLAKIYAASDIYAWPAVNEAFGMSFLEAQAAGMAVVAGNYGGVAEVAGGGILTPPGDVAAFASALSGLLDDDLGRISMGCAAQERIFDFHDIGPAAATIDNALKDMRP